MNTTGRLTREQAIELHNSKFWEEMSYRDRAMFQLNEPRLCMPFEIFHEAVEKAIGRPVYTHEFAFGVDGLKQELMNGAPAPTFDEILSLIPERLQTTVLVV